MCHFRDIREVGWWKRGRVKSKMTKYQYFGGVLLALTMFLNIFSFHLLLSVTTDMTEQYFLRLTLTS